MMKLRGVRGAITVSKDTKEEILNATERLLGQIVSENEMDTEDLASAFFTLTSDLKAIFPAVAARRMGWTDIPLLDIQQLEIEGSLEKCIRVLLHWNTDKLASDIKHIYLEEAKQLRPDLSK